MKDDKGFLDELQDNTVDNLNIDEAMGKIALLLSDPEKIKMHSELAPQEIGKLSALYSVDNHLNKIYGVKKNERTVLRTFCDEFITERISKSRKGRKEIVDMVKANNDAQNNRLKDLFKIGGVN